MSLPLSCDIIEQQEGNMASNHIGQQSLKVTSQRPFGGPNLTCCQPVNMENGPDEQKPVCMLVYIAWLLPLLH